MSSNNITKEQVFSLADELNSVGKTPSTVGIQEKIGKGSRSTVHKFLTEWRRNKDIEKVMRYPIPPELKLQLVKQVGDMLSDTWAQGAESQESATYKSLDDLKNQVVDLESLWNEAKEELERTKSKVSQLESKITDLNVEKGKKDGMLEALQKENEVLRKDTKELREDLLAIAKK